MVAQKSLDRVLESTSNACQYIIDNSYKVAHFNYVNCHLYHLDQNSRVLYVPTDGQTEYYTYLIAFVGEEDLVEDLSGLVLDGIHLNEVGRVAANTSAERRNDNETVTANT